MPSSGSFTSFHLPSMHWLVRLAVGLGVNVLLARAIVLENLPNTIAQCGQISIRWSLSRDEQRSPFTITVLPFASEPFNLTVTPSSNEDAGIFNTSLSVPSGTSFLLAAGNGSQATTSSSITVTPSSDSSCLGPLIPPPFFVRVKPDNCIPSLFNLTCGAFNCTDVPIVRGFVPKGRAPFPVAAVGSPAQWFISVNQETQFLLEFTNSDGRRVGTSQLFTVGGPSATAKCSSFVFFLSTNTSLQMNLPARPSSKSRISSHIIIAAVLAGSVGVVVLLWGLFFLWRHLKKRRQRRTNGIDIGSGGSRTMTDRDFVLDSEFGLTFSSVVPSARWTATSKAFSKTSSNRLDRYSRATVPLPLDRGESRRLPIVPPLRIPTKPPPIKIPSYVPLDITAEPPTKSGEGSINQGKFSPSLLPDWAQRSLSVKSTATTVKRQTRESGRVV